MKFIFRLAMVLCTACLTSLLSWSQAPVLSLAALLDQSQKNQDWIRANQDQFSWMVFALIAKTADKGRQTKLPNGVWTNNSEWETWANDDFTFPLHPVEARPPIWQDRLKPNALGKTLHPDPLQSILSASYQNIDVKNVIGPITRGLADSLEEVRRNQVAFTFITENKLWYREGIKKFARLGQPMKFSPGSIEIKAFWEPAVGTVCCDSHVNYASDGKAYRLIGIHISTNAIPEWTWATFEWTGNIGRCDFEPCLDTFGLIPNTPELHPGPSSDPYPAGKLTTALEKLFKQTGINKKEWDGYRLKGSQSLLPNGQTKPEVLGNSANEAAIIHSSSCIACHERARVERLSGIADSSGGLKVQSPPLGFTNYLSPLALSEENSRGDFSATDFVWAFLKACSTEATSSPPCIR